MELPPLNAVFITHQDVDHCNLGVLMTLPEEVPIIALEAPAGRPWEVDLAKVIHTILGNNRKVIRLKHEETIEIRNMRATAFPFAAEMPSSLKTSWNCYLFETDDAAVACTADSAITDECVDFLIHRLKHKSRPLTLCARSIHSGMKSPGHRDELHRLLNFTRLWAWYVPTWDLFQPVEMSGISETRFRRLSQETNFNFYLPYAMGTAPWFRIADPADPLYVPMANLSADELQQLGQTASALCKKPCLFPGKFAQPVDIGTNRG
jgi:hypothetical protein